MTDDRFDPLGSLDPLDPLQIGLEALHQASVAASEAEDRVRRLVYDLRDRHGASWTLIASALGTTRQAAHKRFSQPPPGQMI